MPDGLQYLLSAPGRQKFVTILADDRPSLYTEDYIQQLLNNFADVSVDNPGKKYHIHLLLFAYNVEKFSLKPEITTTHNYLVEPAENLDKVFNALLVALKKKPNVSTTVLIIDDFSMFSLLAANRDCSRLSNFLRKISQKFQKVFIFSHKQTIGPDETAVLYDVASSIAILGSFYGSSLSSQNFFVCDLLKIKPERRVSHEQSKFEVRRGEIIEQLTEELWKNPVRNQDEVLKNLTTFKLTLEDNEKESRSRLYLPYFDAQKIAVEDPENYDDFEDEDDEEV